MKIAICALSAIELFSGPRKACNREKYYLYRFVSVHSKIMFMYLSTWASNRTFKNLLAPWPLCLQCEIFCLCMDSLFRIFYSFPVHLSYLWSECLCSLSFGWFRRLILRTFHVILIVSTPESALPSVVWGYKPLCMTNDD